MDVLDEEKTLHTQYRAEYVNFMSEIIETGYAWKVNAEELLSQAGKVWFQPHHGVYHPNRSNNIRVVSDCPARDQGE